MHSKKIYLAKILTLTNLITGKIFSVILLNKYNVMYCTKEVILVHMHSICTKHIFPLGFSINKHLI